MLLSHLSTGTTAGRDTFKPATASLRIYWFRRTLATGNSRWGSSRTCRLRLGYRLICKLRNFPPDDLVELHGHIEHGGAHCHFFQKAQPDVCNLSNRIDLKRDVEVSLPGNLANGCRFDWGRFEAGRDIDVQFDPDHIADSEGSAFITD